MHEMVVIGSLILLGPEMGMAGGQGGEGKYCLMGAGQAQIYLQGRGSTPPLRKNY